MSIIKVSSVNFTSELDARATGENEWTLLAPFAATIHLEGGAKELVFVPEGFVTDLASVPRLPGMFLVFGGHARKSAVLHDYLYSVRAEREYADAVLLAAMKNEEPAWRRFFMWAGVRLGGWTRYLNQPAATPHGDL